MKHYRKMHDTPVYKDIIYRELLKDKIRDKILVETLRCDEYDNAEVYNFLKLLIVKTKQFKMSKLILKEELGLSNQME